MGAWIAVELSRIMIESGCLLERETEKNRLERVVTPVWIQRYGKDHRKDKEGGHGFPVEQALPQIQQQLDTVGMHQWELLMKTWQPRASHCLGSF